MWGVVCGDVHGRAQARKSGYNCNMVVVFKPLIERILCSQEFLHTTIYSLCRPGTMDSVFSTAATVEEISSNLRGW